MKLFGKRIKNIVIAGCGRTGAELAMYFYRKNHHVTVIDTRKEAFQKLSSDYGGERVTGDAGDFFVLEKAGIKEADLFVAVTDRDNVNLFTAELVQYKYQLPNIVSRVDDEDKQSLLKQSGIELFCPIKISEEEKNRFEEWGL
ncbi:MAG: TrkA family potassium uptake protein [Lachnospiraceae bacterium]|nr:TrkA family potassium uptake protein [Lachnospiraceae bacterium]